MDQIEYSFLYTQDGCLSTLFLFDLSTGADLMITTFLNLPQDFKRKGRAQGVFVSLWEFFFKLL